MKRENVMDDHEGIRKKNSPATERQEVAAKRQRLEEDKLKYQQERKQFEEMKKAFEQKTDKRKENDQELANEIIQKANLYLQATEQREAEITKRLQILLEKQSEVEKSIGKMEAEIEITNGRLRDATKRLEKAEKGFLSLVKEASRVEKALAKFERRKAKLQRQ